MKETIPSKQALSKQEIEFIQKQSPFFIPVIDEKFVGNKKFTLYPFIQGRKFSSLPLSRVQEIGKNVGKMLSSLAKNEIQQPLMEINKIKENFLLDIEFFFNSRPSPFNISKEDFIREGLDLLNSFTNSKQNLIHGDIKPENLIITNDKIYFIDLDEMKNGFFSFNFQFTCQMLFYRSKKYSGFFKELILSYFDNNVPSCFIENYKFMLYNKFFNRARIFIEKGDKVGETLFYKEFKHIFNIIRKQDWKIF